MDRQKGKFFGFEVLFLMRTGTVKWFDEAKGFGFIAPEDGSSDVFVHYSVIEGKGFRTLAENQKVEFEFKVGPKGPQATMVKKFAAPAAK
jgi:CspA family cold shock protein